MTLRQKIAAALRDEVPVPMWAWLAVALAVASVAFVGRYAVYPAGAAAAVLLYVLFSDDEGGDGWDDAVEDPAPAGDPVSVC